MSQRRSYRYRLTGTAAGLRTMRIDFPRRQDALTAMGKILGGRERDLYTIHGAGRLTVTELRGNAR